MVNPEGNTNGFRPMSLMKLLIHTSKPAQSLFALVTVSHPQETPHAVHTATEGDMTKTEGNFCNFCSSTNLVHTALGWCWGHASTKQFRCEVSTTRTGHLQKEKNSLCCQAWLNGRRWITYGIPNWTPVRRVLHLAT